MAAKIGKKGRGDAAPPPRTEARTVFKSGFLSALSSRDFDLLLFGAMLSNIGTWIHNTVLFWYVRDITRSDAWVGALNLVNFLPIIFFVLLAGSLADRLNRKRLIIVTQAVMMLSALALGICTQFGVANLPVIMVVTGIMGMAFTFTFPATRAFITDLVPPRDIHNAIAIDAAQFNITRFIGPVIAIAIYTALNIHAAFYINAASFLTVIAALMLIRTRTPRSRIPQGSMPRHMREGVRHILGNRWSRNLLIVLGLFSFFGISFIVLLPGLAQDVLEEGQRGYGLLLGSFGLGAVIGAPLVTLLARRLEAKGVIKISTMLFGLFMIAFSFCRDLWACMLLAMGLGATSLMISSTVNAVLQSRVERNMRGRIMSLYIFVFQGMSPLGSQLLGLVSDHASVPLALLFSGVMVAVLGVVILLFPSILRETAFGSGHMVEC